MTCNICCEKYNKSINSKVICEINDCNFEACKTCIRTYLLGTTNDPHCMTCKNQWSTKFLVENLNRSFMDNDYKKHRKLLLAEREISRTPELMHLVERTKLIDDHTCELNETIKQHNEIRKLFFELSNKVSEQKLQIYKLKNGENIEKEKKKFIMPCRSDNCKGYLSTQYKCEICKLFTCPDCFEIIGYSKEDTHTCSNDNLKSTELIKKETKGCPKCGVRIFKISGCDQMFCTECKVAFSWNTGKIVISQNIHNPHYYNYLRENNLATTGQVPRNPGDIVCGGLIPYYSLNNLIRFLNKFNSANRIDILMSNQNISGFLEQNSITHISEIITMVSNLHRLVNHITAVELINAREKVRELINFDTLMVQYILNKKTKDELATTIFRNDNLRKKKVEILNIYELISVVGIERFNNLYAFYYDNLRDERALVVNDNFIKIFELIVIMITEYNNLLNYCNKQLITISYTYNQCIGIIEIPSYLFRSKKFYKSDLTRLEKMDKTVSGNGEEEASCSYH